MVKQNKQTRYEETYYLRKIYLGYWVLNLFSFSIAYHM